MRTYSVSSEHYIVSCMAIYRNIPLSVTWIYYSQLLKSLSKRSANPPLKRSSVSMKRSSQFLMSKTGSKQHYSPQSYQSILRLWPTWKTNPNRIFALVCLIGMPRGKTRAKRYKENVRFEDFMKNIYWRQNYMFRLFSSILL